MRLKSSFSHFCAMLLKHIWFLLRKDFLLEWREKNAISAIVLYVLSTTFVIYQIFISVEPFAWIALYWIIVLFASVNAAAKSFIQEKGNTQLYYYQLVGPQAIILSKMAFSTAFILVLTIIATAFFSLLLGFPINSMLLWFGISALGGTGLAVTFTMISAIAAKASNSGVLMTILGVPLVIPQLLLLVKVSKTAIQASTFSVLQADLLGLGASLAIVISISLVFFPYLWRD